MDEEKFKEVLTEEIKKRLDEQFMRGLVGGFNAACESIYNQCKNLTSAKAIKEVLRKEYEEATKRNRKIDD